MFCSLITKVCGYIHIKEHTELLTEVTPSVMAVYRIRHRDNVINTQLGASYDRQEDSLVLHATMPGLPFKQSHVGLWVHLTTYYIALSLLGTCNVSGILAKSLPNHPIMLLSPLSLFLLTSTLLLSHQPIVLLIHQGDDVTPSLASPPVLTYTLLSSLIPQNRCLLLYP